MKKAILLISGLLIFLGLNAQEFTFEDLPEIVRHDMLIEEEDFQDMQLPDSSVINGEIGYYKGSRRSESTDTLIYYQWHRIDEEWIPVHRLIKTYDDFGKVISSLLQHHRPQGDEWVNGVLKSYTYAQGLLTDILIQFWHPYTQDWYNHFHKTFSYYDDGKLSEIIHQKWFFETQDWADRFRRVFVYNTEGNISSDTVYHFRPFFQDWGYAWLHEYFYNDSGFRTENRTSHYLPDSASWQYVHRDLLNPDDSGQVQDITVQNWFRPLQTWQNVKWIIFTYDDQELITERLVKHWHHFDSAWVDAYRNLYAYDANENLDTLIFQFWHRFNNNWANKELDDFEYDASGTLLSRLTQRWDPWSDTWVNWRLMELVIDLKHLVAGTDGPGEITGQEIRLSYPNPYNSSYPVILSGSDNEVYTVKLSDLSGQIVFMDQVTSGQSFRIEGDVTPGLYILVVSNRQKVLKSSKILITR